MAPPSTVGLACGRGEKSLDCEEGEQQMKRKWEDKKRLSRKMFKVGQSEKQGDKDTFSKKTGTKEKLPE